MKYLSLLAVPLLLWSCTTPQTTLAPPDPPANIPAAAGAGVATTWGATPNTAVRQVLAYPTRLTAGPAGTTYVSDARLGSVFVLDDQQRVIRELKNIARPLGVASDAEGRIYVGSGVHQHVRVYDAHGHLERTLGVGQLLMPNDLTLDREGRLYVADSSANRVQVFEADGSYVQTIGTRGTQGAQLQFPTAVEVSYRATDSIVPHGELFVADQGSGRILVFDLEGRLLRQFGERARAFSAALLGQFARLQSLTVDPEGLVHALDSQLGTVQVFDAESGVVVHQYGALGRQAGRLMLPLDILMLPSGAALVANAGNQRLERIDAAITAGAAGTRRKP